MYYTVYTILTTDYFPLFIFGLQRISKKLLEQGAARWHAIIKECEREQTSEIIVL